MRDSKDGKENVSKRKELATLKAAVLTTFNAFNYILLYRVMKISNSEI